MRWKKRIIKLLVIFAVGFGSSVQAQDDLLFDGGAPDLNRGLRISDIGFVVSAADFKITNGWHVTSAEFWTHEMPDSFEWDGTVSYFVFEDEADRPSGSPIYSGQAQSIVKTADPDVNTIYLGFKYSFNFEVPLKLEADKIYWLALNLGGGGTMDSTQAFWAGTGSRILSAAFISFDLSNWGEYYFDLAFRLYGSLPPPPPCQPTQGTIGTEITIDGIEFGEKKGKVLIGTSKCKVLEWTDTAINCLIKKVPTTGPGTYDVTIKPKGKGIEPIVLEDAFSIMAPSIDNINPDSGFPEDEVTITGSFFGTKKVKVYMDDGIRKKPKKCKVTSLTMDSNTGASTLVILVPKKGLLPGVCDATLTNKVGSDTLEDALEIQ